MGSRGPDSLRKTGHIYVPWVGCLHCRVTILWRVAKSVVSVYRKKALQKTYPRGRGLAFSI
jgi:hypothetical protein